MTRGPRLGIPALLLVAGAAPALAEPIFLSRQYTRCTNCHYSPTGGGLLTPYGRSLSREELSTFGRSHDPERPGREQEFLFGLLGKATGPLSLGVDLRPSRLEFESQGSEDGRSLLMNADLTAALRHGSFTFFAEVGRQPRGDDARVASFEHWIQYEREGGLGLRAGRFIPAYGIKLADHTSYNRSYNRLDNDDQVYALELSFNGRRQLLQASIGPGFADSVDDGELRALTATARWQYDLRPNAFVVASGLYRDASELEPRESSLGLAAGFAPASRLSLFVQGDLRSRDSSAGSDTAYTLLGDVELEAYRGVWLRFSPQLATAYGDSSAGFLRLVFGLNLLPRTHWNAVLQYYHDRDRVSDRTFNTLLAQLHLYL